MAEQGLHQLCVENGEWLQKDCKSFFNKCGLSGLSELWVFLCTFMNVYGTFGWFCFVAVTFDVFVDRLSHFVDPIWGYIGHFSGQNRVIVFGGVDPGSVWGSLGIILASFWHHFGSFRCGFDPILRLFGPFWAVFRPFLAHFSPFLGHFYGLFEVFWRCFECKNKQNDAIEGKNMRIPVKHSPKWCKTVRKRAIFAYKTLVSLENQQKWTFNLRKCAVCRCAWKDPE